LSPSSSSSGSLQLSAFFEPFRRPSDVDTINDINDMPFGAASMPNATTTCDLLDGALA
jgi:hypothetical protein